MGHFLPVYECFLMLFWFQVSKLQPETLQVCKEMVQSTEKVLRYFVPACIKFKFHVSSSSNELQISAKKKKQKKNKDSENGTLLDEVFQHIANVSVLHFSFPS